MRRIKEKIRERVWELMERRNIARFPRPVVGRIPNFEGADRAAKRLADLPVFQRAEVLKVNPDSPQRWVRQAALFQGKKLVMPTPRLKRGFLLLDPANIPGSGLRAASTISGAFVNGKPVKLRDLPRVDLVVAGSVAVSPEGARIGKGGGYSELEYALLREMQLVEEGTPVATTVHDVQVLDEIPQERHDVKVTCIVTPSKVIQTSGRHSQPKGIFWEKVTSAMIHDIPLIEDLVNIKRTAKPE
ncbi:MAG: 5-formyltetrahydrofolate cyclo-ligase [Aigarchaeota archaeon]|nr:5-formyltetrahydrofolate cyclo-ligase [Aigarchaeota archaeon]MDH5703090.1 5-formyltetrahydrofolate cyclo-ligase [Aigarchaeota archaeon]